VAEEKLKELFWSDRQIARALDSVFPEVLDGAKSPYRAARELVAALSIGKNGG
jgi:hypothetical protein